MKRLKGAVPYLPPQSTLAEATEWLHAKTGERWSLPRLIEAGADVGLWLTCAPDAPEVLDTLFMGRREGMFARITFQGDLERLASARDRGSLTWTLRPDGQAARLTPPLEFDVDEVRFAVASLRAIAAAYADGRVLREEDQDHPGLLRWMELHGGPAGARLDVLLVPSHATVASPRGASESRTAREDRLLAEFEARGGRMEKCGSIWSFQAGEPGLVAAISRVEKAAGRPRWTTKDIGSSLKAALERRQERQSRS